MWTHQVFGGTRLLAATLLLAVVVMRLATLRADGPAMKAAPAGKLPSLATVKATVERTLAVDRNYRPGDLISQRHGSAVLGELKTAGWEVEQGRQLLARLPADSDFLVRAS